MSRLRVPHLLVALSVVPILGGLFRLNSLWVTTPAQEAARYAAVSAPLTLHIIFASLFSVLGAFQFDAELRAKKPHIHRALGRLSSIAGLLAAASGIVLTVISDIPREQQGPLLYAVRIVVGLATVASVVNGVVQVVGGRVASHQAWMVRAYALGQGAGTQVILFLPLALVMGREVVGLQRDVLMTTAWVINVVIAEAIISKGRVNRVAPAARQA